MKDWIVPEIINMKKNIKDFLWFFNLLKDSGCFKAKKNNIINWVHIIYKRYNNNYTKKRGPGTGKWNYTLTRFLYLCSGK